MASSAAKLSWRWVFGIVALFGLSLIPAAAYRAFGLTGILIWILSVAILVSYRRDGLAFLVFAIPVVAMVLLPAVGDRGPQRRTGCVSNVREIELAILNYESASRRFPPPYTVDSHGNRLHSWRVLILPYLEETELFDQIDLTKPWNDPVNLKFADRMPDVFRCPKLKPKTRAQRNTTAYVAVVGDQTMWPPSGQRKRGDVKDRDRDTLSIVESETYRTNWMAPDDPTFDQVVNTDGTGQSLLSNSPHQTVAVAAFADWHTKALPCDLDLATLRAMLTIAGGEELPK